ncbi:MAG: NAD(P)/FAD-dependent oxidoreductase [Candidatus Micrarchaeia archaeon]
MDCDAVVIGGGPAGSSFARVASKRGLKVIVIEKKKDLGSPVRCGEGIGGHWIDELGFKIGPGVGYAIEGAAVYAPDGREIVVKNKETTGYVVERKIFDKQLAIEAARKGAKFLPKTMATGLLKDAHGKPAGVSVLRDGEAFEVRAPLVVSAEGMEAKLAREAGFKAVSTLYDVDSCYEYEMVNVECRRFIELYFGNAIAPRGYVWVFPKGDDVANVGIGVGGSMGADPKRLLDEFIARDPRFAKAEPIEVKGGVISVGAPIDSFVKDGFMVIGTAAHQVDPIHGGGIALAIEAGEIAADTAVEAFGKQDYSASVLSRYEREWRAKEGGKQDKRLKLRKVIEMLSDDDYNHIFKEIGDSDLLKVLDSDFKPVVAKILLKRPSLLKVLRALI